jgi:hypothetical protein
VKHTELSSNVLTSLTGDRCQVKHTELSSNVLTSLTGDGHHLNKFCTDIFKILR